MLQKASELNEFLLATSERSERGDQTLLFPKCAAMVSFLIAPLLKLGGFEKKILSALVRILVVRCLLSFKTVVM